MSLAEEQQDIALLASLENAERLPITVLQELQESTDLLRDNQVSTALRSLHVQGGEAVDPSMASLRDKITSLRSHRGSFDVLNGDAVHTVTRDSQKLSRLLETSPNTLDTREPRIEPQLSQPSVLPALNDTNSWEP
jgi:hypothetical protein